MEFNIIIFVLLLPFTFGQMFMYPRAPEAKKCGYESCNKPKPGYLNVHIVCHTHLDTGWVKTYDQYYYKYVSPIVDSVINSLLKDRNRKFSFVEISFFSRKWNQISEDQRDAIRHLVENGQFEFINGGWSMNDEATAYYRDIIDQLTLGHKWLNRTFGECARPKVGWQIDPFGHSREMASIFSQMKMDAEFLGRIDFQDKLLREQTATMEMIWKSSPSLGNKADIFTSVLPNIYWPPKNFCFDINCYDELIYESNALEKAREFIKIVKEQSLKYATNNTIITMGMDFYYRDAEKWYSNLDLLIAAVNSIEKEYGVHMFYSTPSCYAKALHESHYKWPVKMDDFFPYADARNAYWTGFYTSRASLKRHIKYASSVLDAAKQLSVFANLDAIYENKLMPLRESLGILQHHDGVTGTCKQFVSDDYTRMLSASIQSAEECITDAYRKLWLGQGLVPTTGFAFCNNLNTSSCYITDHLKDSMDVVLHLYNSLGHKVKHYMTLPVSNALGYTVRDHTGAIINSQITLNHIGMENVPRASTSKAALIFPASLPAMGAATYTIEKVVPPNKPDPNQVSQVLHHYVQDVTITNGQVTAVFDGTSGLLKEVLLADGTRIPLEQNFHIYQAEGRNFNGEKPSGAYAFNPTNDAPYPSTNKATYKVIKGGIVEEVHQRFNDWIYQVVRLYKDIDCLELDWIVGPIPPGYYSNSGQEVISKFKTNFKTNGTFFTDSNCRETIRRVRDHRPTWKLDTTEKASSNYYPIQCWLFIRDYSKDFQLTLLTDRAEGGSSLEDGAAELMVHRRLYEDDGYGMEEALNEPGEDNRGLVVRGKHRVCAGYIKDGVRMMRIMSKALNSPPIPTFRTRHRDQSYRRAVNYEQPHNQRISFNNRPLGADPFNFIGLNYKLPANVHILTLEQWTDDLILLRIECFFEINEDVKYSRSQKVWIGNLFVQFKIVEATEMTLNANQKLSEADGRQLKWRAQFDPYHNYSNVLKGSLNTKGHYLYPSIDRRSPSNLMITLRPMEIRTFLCKIEYRKPCYGSQTGGLTYGC